MRAAGYALRTIQIVSLHGIHESLRGGYHLRHFALHVGAVVQRGLIEQGHELRIDCRDRLTTWRRATMNGMFSTVAPGQ